MPYIQRNLLKEEQSGGITLPLFKLYYREIAIKKYGMGSSQTRARTRDP